MISVMFVHVYIGPLSEYDGKQSPCVSKYITRSVLKDCSYLQQIFTISSLTLSLQTNKKPQTKKTPTFLLAQCPYFYSSMSLFIAFKWWLIWNYVKHVGFYFNKNQDFRKLKINKNVSTNFVKNSSGKHILISSNLSLNVLAI